VRVARRLSCSETSFCSETSSYVLPAYSGLTARRGRFGQRNGSLVHPASGNRFTGTSPLPQRRHADPSGSGAAPQPGVAWPQDVFPSPPARQDGRQCVLDGGDEVSSRRAGCWPKYWSRPSLEAASDRRDAAGAGLHTGLFTKPNAVALISNPSYPNPVREMATSPIAQFAADAARDRRSLMGTHRVRTTGPCGMDPADRTFGSPIPNRATSRHFPRAALHYLGVRGRQAVG
jgi:hypothetical protein